MKPFLSALKNLLVGNLKNFTLSIHGYVFGIVCVPFKSRPETQRWGIKTGEKGHKAYKKSRGNVPLGSERQGLDKKEGDKSHVKGAV
ncbi:hypothetical protein TNCV_2715431 [Trichonephila clavipes]|nr:hypothetical protein TNCV_2715431 [Trichonephila clavipes]